MSQLLEFLQHQLSNQFFSGGLILGTLAGVAAYCRSVPGYLWRWARSRLVVTVDVSDHDQAFFWIQVWLGRHEYTKSRARLLTLTTRTAPVGQDVPKSVTTGRHQPEIEIIFSPNFSLKATSWGRRCTVPSSFTSSHNTPIG